MSMNPHTRSPALVSAAREATLRMQCSPTGSTSCSKTRSSGGYGAYRPPTPVSSTDSLRSRSRAPSSYACAFARAGRRPL